MKLTRSKGTVVLVYKPGIGHVVKSVTQTLKAKMNIGQCLTDAEVQTLIDDAFTVRVLAQGG